MAQVKNLIVEGDSRLIGDTNAGNITATTLKKSGGTSSQFLKADGSVDSSTYATTSQIPTVNNATLTIQKNGTTVNSFTANASSNVTANITVPTKVSELTNDSGFTTNTGTVTSVGTGVGLTGGSITSTGTIKAKLKEETLNTAASARSASADGGLYSVEADKDGNLAVRVPWTDHTYTVNDGTFKVKCAGNDVTSTSANSSSDKYINFVAGSNVTLTPDSSTQKITIAATDTNTHRPIQVNGTQVLGDNTTALNLYAGDNVTLTNSSGTVTIKATDTTYSNATQSAAGLMSSTDKTKLDGVAIGATANIGTVTAVAVNGSTILPYGTTGTVTLPDYPTVPSLSSLTLSTTAQAYDGTHTLALPSSDPYSSARTPSSHTHGNIQNGGTLQTTDIAIASGDKLVVTDSSDSNKVARTSVSFDASTTTKALTPKGTFETFLQSHQSVVNGGNTASWGNSCTVGTVGGTALTFTMPSNPDTNTTYTFTAPTTGTDANKLVITPSSGTATKLTIPYATSAGTASSASSSSSANTAGKLANTSKIGDTNKPVYFTANGVPEAISYTIEKSVPSNAVFTDTTYESKAAASGGTAVSLCTTGEKYTWNNKSDLAIGTTASTAAAGNHTHTTTLASDTGTSSITLANGGKYKLTAGGTNVIFTMPSGGSSDVYWATYQTTPYSDIKTALLINNKVVLMRFANQDESEEYILRATYYNDIDQEIYFMGFLLDYQDFSYSYSVCVNENNTWIDYGNSLQSTSYRASSIISSNKTSALYYASTKAVYDYVDRNAAGKYSCTKTGGSGVTAMFCCNGNLVCYGASTSFSGTFIMTVANFYSAFMKSIGGYTLEKEALSDSNKITELAYLMTNSSITKLAAGSGSNTRSQFSYQSINGSTGTPVSFTYGASSSGNRIAVSSSGVTVTIV